MNNIAVILAAGSGKRVGGDIPKQYMLLPDGMSVMEKAVAAFEQAPQIDGIFVVAHKSWFDTVITYSKQRQWQKFLGLIEGGAERWESSRNAVEKVRFHQQNCGVTDCNILLHDCARPFVSQCIIADVCAALENYLAVTVAIPATDTMYICRNDILTDIPPRRTLLRAQTPQAFRLSVIHEAYECASKENFTEATDDCGILRRFKPEVRIKIVAGEEENRKITFIKDLHITIG